MTDLFGYAEPAAPFRDIRNTRESVAEEKARLCLELNAICKTPPPVARRRVDKSGSRVARRAQIGAEDPRVKRLKPHTAGVGYHEHARV